MPAGPAGSRKPCCHPSIVSARSGSPCTDATQPELWLCRSHRTEGSARAATRTRCTLPRAEVVTRTGVTAVPGGSAAARRREAERRHVPPGRVPGLDPGRASAEVDHPGPVARRELDRAAAQDVVVGHRTAGLHQPPGDVQHRPVSAPDLERRTGVRGQHRPARPPELAEAHGQQVAGPRVRVERRRKGHPGEPDREVAHRHRARQGDSAVDSDRGHLTLSARRDLDLLGERRGQRVSAHQLDGAQGHRLRPAEMEPGSAVARRGSPAGALVTVDQCAGPTGSTGVRRARRRDRHRGAGVEPAVQSRSRTGGRVERGPVGAGREDGGPVQGAALLRSTRHRSRAQPGADQGVAVRALVARVGHQPRLTAADCGRHHQGARGLKTIHPDLREAEGSQAADRHG